MLIGNRRRLHSFLLEEGRSSSRSFPSAGRKLHGESIIQPGKGLISKCLMMAVVLVEGSKNRTGLKIMS
jgi:hypothetical protein